MFIIIDQIFLKFLNPLLNLGYEQSLTEKDLGPLENDMTTENVYKEFEIYWKEELKLIPEKRSLWRPLLKTVGYKYQLFGILLSCISAASAFGPPIILKSLNGHFNGSEQLSQTTLWILVSLLFIIPVFGSSCLSNCYVIFTKTATISRNILTSSIFRKVLVMSSSSKRDFTTGRVLNLFSVDILTVQMFLLMFAAEMFAPCQLAGALYLIYREIGVAMFAGFGLVFAVIPLLLVSFVFYGKLRTAKNIPSDARIKLTNEILNGIRIIKYYGWEIPFINKIEALRVIELDYLFKLSINMIIIISLITSIPFIMPVIMFYTYAKINNQQLTLGIAFTVLALLGLVTTPVMMIPGFIQRAITASIAANRILKFLQCNEIENYILFDEKYKKDNYIMYLDNTSFSWITQKEIDDNAIVEENEKNKINEKNKTIEKNENKKNNDSINDIKEIELITKDGNEIENKKENDNKKDNEIPINRSVSTLMNISINIEPGTLIGVVGPVGSGKSSLLAAFLGDIRLTNGIVYRGSNNIAYHSQQAWILNATVKDNILFGLPYDEEKFKSAVDASCLQADIDMLPAGLETEIGEKGINLSGGQKARVSFARTVYRNADIYLLDDPLSAVDAHVGMHIFKKGICEILKGKTIILVTHQVHLLTECNKLIVLMDGMIRCQGTYDEINKAGIDLNKIVESSNNKLLLNENDKENNNNIIINRNISNSIRHRTQSKDRSRTLSTDITLRNRNKSVDIPNDLLTSKNNNAVNNNYIELKNKDIDIEKNDINEMNDDDIDDIDNNDNIEKSPIKDKIYSASLITTEERAIGDVPWSIYNWYFLLGGYIWVFLALLIAIIGSGVYTYGSFWLADWGEEVLHSYETTGLPLSPSRNLYYVNIYAALTVSGLIGIAFRTLFMTKFSIEASFKMHSKLLISMMDSPISFFDTTPLGRILNRFTTDISLADEALGSNFSFTMGMIASLIANVGSLCYTTDGFMAILIIPLTFIFTRVQLFYRRSNTELKRIDNITRSPIFAEFNQTLNGVSSVRAYSAEKQFIIRLEKYVDKSSRVQYLLQLIKWWLAIRLEIIGGLVSCFIGCIAVGAPNVINRAYIPLSLNGAFALVGTLKWLVNISSEVEASMNSVERIKYYSDVLLPEETDEIKKLYKPLPKEWPTDGKIVAKNLQVKYSDGPLVLKGINFVILPKETIGIVGRTGCGKSTLMVALFRIENPCGGIIEVDGIDLSTISLKELRPKFGIIPQDPVVFSITVRFNLDPFDQYTDNELWDVLDRVMMKDTVLSFPLKLLEPVSESGDNFSAGQRQLICIARVLLRKPKILIMDEATASVDNETDTLIQTMIKEKFKDSTILTIAHRLHTVIDSSRIMLLNEGNIIEMDTPKKLLENKNGMFTELWNKHVNSRS